MTPEQAYLQKEASIEAEKFSKKMSAEAKIILSLILNSPEEILYYIKKEHHYRYLSEKSIIHVFRKILRSNKIAKEVHKEIRTLLKINGGI